MKMTSRNFITLQDVDGQTVELEERQFTDLVEQIRNIKMPTLNQLILRVAERFIIPLILTVASCIYCFTYNGDNVVFIDGCNCLKQIFLCISLLILGACIYVARIEWTSICGFKSLKWDGTTESLVCDIKDAELYLLGTTIVRDNPTKLMHITQTSYRDYKIFKIFTSDGLLCHEAITPDGRALETPHIFTRDITSETLLAEATARNRRMVFDIIDSDIKEGRTHGYSDRVANHTGTEGLGSTGAY